MLIGHREYREHREIINSHLSLIIRKVIPHTCIRRYMLVPAKAGAESTENAVIARLPKETAAI